MLIARHLPLKDTTAQFLNYGEKAVCDQARPGEKMKLILNWAVVS